MGFMHPTPIEPGPKGKYQPTREGDTLKALGESKSVLERLMTFLAPYQPNNITDVSGRRFQVLAVDFGKEDVVAASKPFQLVAFKDGATQKVKVLASTMAGDIPTTPSPDGDGNFIFTPSGTQKIYGKITINSSTGVIATRELEAGASLPADTATEFHVLIGQMKANGTDSATVINYRYGPINAAICRIWFAAEAPFFGVNWS